MGSVTLNTSYKSQETNALSPVQQVQEELDELERQIDALRDLHQEYVAGEITESQYSQDITTGPGLQIYNLTNDLLNLPGSSFSPSEQQLGNQIVGFADSNVLQPGTKVTLSELATLQGKVDYLQQLLSGK